MQKETNPIEKPVEKPVVEKPKSNAGRKTLYTKDMQDKADKFIEGYALFETYQKEIVVKDQIQVINAERPSGIPSISGLALHLKVHRETLYNWGKTHRQFFDTLEDMKAKQEQYLEYHGLTRGYDASFSRFLATNLTKYREKIETKEEINTKVELSYKVE